MTRSTKKYKDNSRRIAQPTSNYYTLKPESTKNTHGDPITVIPIAFASCPDCDYDACGASDLCECGFHTNDKGVGQHCGPMAFRNKLNMFRDVHGMSMVN